MIFQQILWMKCIQLTVKFEEKVAGRQSNQGSYEWQKSNHKKNNLVTQQKNIFYRNKMAHNNTV